GCWGNEHHADRDSPHPGRGRDVSDSGRGHGYQWESGTWADPGLLIHYECEWSHLEPPDRGHGRQRTLHGDVYGWHDSRDRYHTSPHRRWHYRDGFHYGDSSG